MVSLRTSTYVPSGEETTPCRQRARLVESLATTGDGLTVPFSREFTWNV